MLVISAHRLARRSPSGSATTALAGPGRPRRSGWRRYVLVFYRRRWPLPSPSSSPLLSAGLGIAGRPVDAGRGLARDPPPLAQIVAGRRRSNFAAAQVYHSMQPARPSEPVVARPSPSTSSSSRRCSGWGMYIGSRRELLWTLRSRAERAEAEQELRVAQAREQRARPDRPRDARRARPPDLPDLDARRRARPTARTSPPTQMRGERRRDPASRRTRRSTDLRGVLGVLRDDDRRAAGPPAADVRRPRRRWSPRRATSGMRVDFDDRLERRAPVPDAVGPDGLPDRPGGHHQRPQARARGAAHVELDRAPRTRRRGACCATRIGFGPTAHPGRPGSA